MLSNPDPSVSHCHCPSIAIAPSGDILVAWYAYPEQETRDGTLILARKRPNASRFDPTTRILTDMNSSLGNPVLFFDDNARLHLLFVALRGQFWDSAVANACHSDDLGRTWIRPQSMPFDAGLMIRHPPVKMSGGQFLLPAYDEKTNQTVILTSGADGVSWTETQRFDGAPAIQGCIVPDELGHWTMMLRPCDPNRYCLRAVTADCGRTWSPVIRTTLPNPLSGLAAFRVNEYLCTVYNHTEQHRRHPLSLAYSTDAGTSWSDPIHIDETEQEVSYPAFAVDSVGIAHGVYTFGRTHIRYVRFDQDWWER